MKEMVWEESTHEDVVDAAGSIQILFTCCACLRGMPYKLTESDSAF